MHSAWRPRPSLRRAFQGLPGRLAILLTLALASGPGTGAREAAAGTHLADRFVADRFTPGRLSTQAEWRACPVVDSAGFVPRSRCGAPRPDARSDRRLARALRDVQETLRRDSSPAALHQAALLEFRLHSGTASALERAVAAQERARRGAPADPAVLNDLAVMYLSLGEREQQLVPMLRALDAVERALARDSTLAPALFNRALILERLYLVGSARCAWARYRRVERAPGWKAEAEAHLRRLERWPQPVAWPDVAAPPAALGDSARAAIADRVTRMPSAARESSFTLLGAWGRAALAGDSAGAARHLAFARAIGGAATARRADRTVALAVGTIESAAADLPRRRALARAHAQLAAGYRLFFAAEYEKAADTLAAAARGLRSHGSPAAGWATFYRAAAEMNLGHFPAADSLYQVAAGGATGAEPALLGRAVWARGANQLRQGYYERAIAFYREALPAVVRAREPESEAAVSYLLSEALLLAGQTVPAREEEYRGLRALSRFRSFGFLNNHLTIVTLDARAAGLEYAALALMNEGVEIANGVARADVVAWAYQARAREYVTLGEAAAARADLDDATRWVAKIDTGSGRDRVRADVMLIRAQLLRHRDPGAALDTLDAVVKVYRRIRIGMNLPEGLFEAARAAQAAGRLADARRYLREAIGALEAQQGSYQTLELRATRAETMEHVFDAMIRLELDAGQPASALDYLERGRMAAWTRDARPLTAAGAAGGRPLIERLGAGLPADMLLLDYALLSDRVVVWTVSRRGWRHHTIPVGRDSVAALVRRFEREAADPGVDAGSVRSRLFELLVRPAAGELRGVRRLAVVPDRELFRLAFPALWDRETGSYVVERYDLRTLPNAAFLLAAAPARRTGTAGSALVVGNPAVDRRLAATLPSLPGAAREAEQVARLYGVPVLGGAEARRAAVVARLSGVSVFHFAGHAVFNGEQPELSYLALAAGEGEGILQAREIGRLHLSNLRVVVLSACSTLNPRPSRAGGNAGLAYSFLRAGAPATVSTVWDVGDGPTAEVLVEFHRRLAGGVPAPEALRLAQVRLLRD
ncbi:MAG: CHAT domain-containing protein, partial [Longimicrobiaceae bacterium]